jgi:intracellular multiplication protein IcmK
VDNVAKINNFFGKVLLGFGLSVLSLCVNAEQSSAQNQNASASLTASSAVTAQPNLTNTASNVATLPQIPNMPQPTQKNPGFATAASNIAAAPPSPQQFPVGSSSPAMEMPVPASVPLPVPTDQLSPAPASGVASGLTPAEADPAVVAAARDQAFDQLTMNTLPMTPAQIQKLRNLFADSNRAATTAPGGVPPKPVSSTQTVSLDPGATPPIIRPYQGYVTSLVFLDSTGAPWPIQAYDIGNPGAFNVQWDRVSNTLMVQSQALYTTGNLVVQLKNLNTPISISLVPGQPIVDYRVDMRIQGLGPNAKSNVSGASLPAAANNDLLNVLDGVPPAKVRPLTIPGSTSQAWISEDKNGAMYLRTHYTLLSPAWIAAMSSADGMNAYQLPKVPSVLVSDNEGKIFNLRIEGY